MPTLREDKPTWSQVPVTVRELAEQIVGARVVRATRAFGGYGPSATFVLNLDDGRRAFFKGVYPLPEGSAVRWALDEEERVYTQLADEIHPWAPAYYGSLRHEGWHALLIESVPGARVLPWTQAKAERAARSYARFHAGTVGTDLPAWLSRSLHLEFVGYWTALCSDDESIDRIAALCATRAHQRGARDWIRRNGPLLAAAEEPLLTAQRLALLHFDTRSDNIRLHGALLRIFDWPWACVGPPEFDLTAFAQSVAAEGGPDPELVVAWYSDVLSVDPRMVIASCAGISGFFADRGSRPDLPGLPRLRPHQRRQFRASLGWAARLIGLPEPGWLATVAD